LAFYWQSNASARAGGVCQRNVTGLQNFCRGGTGWQAFATLQTLQNSLPTGDLNGVQTAFNPLQSLNQNLETANGKSASSSFQLSTDLTAFGSALSAGDLSQRSPPLLR
jgi:hypothetical protein